MSRDNVTRRRLLRGVGAGVASGGMVGTAGAREADDYIVGVRNQRGVEQARGRAESVKRVLDFDDIGKAVAGRFTQQALDALENNPNVRYVEEDGEMHAIEINSDDPEVPWGVDRVDAEEVHSTNTGAGADISIIDTGIDSDHPDLQANLGVGKAFVDCRGPTCNEPWDDDNDHGTHCAGIADAVDNDEGVVGVSTEATLHAVKVLDKRGSGSYSDVAAGIEWTVDQGYDIGSMSLGGEKSSAVEDACEYAYNENGVLLVAAAGNDGPCSNCVSYPAAEPEVIAVSATNKDDALADFSSTGPEVELAAPGVGIYSTVIGGYDTFSGTSMACPHVAGAGGQLMASDYSNTKARDQLNATAEDIGLGDSEQGNGLLDAKAAVLGLPSVSWVNPSDDETVSDSVTIQIEASDPEDSDDSLDVTYKIDGGSSRSTSYNSDTGYYEDSWDTTSVSDGDHTLEANATDSAGNTSSSTITVTTDNTESAPVVDSLSASEVETDDDDAEFDVDWQVSDSDGDLDLVDLTLTEDTSGDTEDTATVSVSGDSASRTTCLVAAGDNGSGNSYTVDLTVTDSNSNTGSDSTSVSETEDTSSAPTIDTFSLTDDSNPTWTRYYVDWEVSDGDGDLADVTSEMLDASANILDSASSSASGSSASGTHYLESKSSASEIRLTVTDEAGNATTSSKSI